MKKSLLALLKEISELIAESENYSELLPSIVKHFANTMKAKVCSIYVYDRENKMLILAANEGFAPESVGKVAMSIEEGLSGLCIQTNKIINIINPSEHKRYKYFKVTGEAELKSLFAVPLNIANNRLGVFTIQRTTPTLFTEDEVYISKAIAGQIANIILNNELIKLINADNPVNQKTEKSKTKNRMIRLKGVSANSGIAMGKAFIFSKHELMDEIKDKNIKNVPNELQLFRTALKNAIQQSILLHQDAISTMSETDASIFYSHILLLEDETIQNKISNLIEVNRKSAEYSIKLVYEEYRKKFEKFDNAVFKERIYDLKDAVIRVIENVISLKNNNNETRNSIIKNESIILVAKELLPSDLMRFPIGNLKGIISEKGGVSAHTSILAKAFQIPSIVKLDNLTDYVSDNDEIIVDTLINSVFIRPTEPFKKRYTDIISSINANESKEDFPASCTTTDGVEIIVKGNIALTSELTLLKKYKADGIGLYRTEFIYMIKDRLPTEEELYTIFCRIVEGANGKKITLRVIDIGTDKPLSYLDIKKEENPALGNRGIRFFLANKSIAKPHIRAVLRAAKLGNINILLPMISTVSEVHQFKWLLNEIYNELKYEDVPFSHNCKVGIMLEVPSSIFDIENIIREVDFVNIGSNDLSQYIFASDRGSEPLKESNLQLHPIFLKVLLDISKVTTKHNKELSVCGEIAGNLYGAPLLIGAGIFNLSMSLTHIPEIRRLLTNFSSTDCRKLLNKAISCNSSNEVIDMMKNEYSKRKIFFTKINTHI